MSLARNWGNSDDEDFEDELFPEKPSSVPKSRTKKPSVSSKASKKSDSVNSLPTGSSRGESAKVSETTSGIDADLDMIFNTTVYGYVRPINDDGSFNVALPIDLEEVTIGRQKQCTLCIQSKTVSRVHAKLSCGADGVCWLECLTDKPVLVDQTRLQLNERVQLYHDSTFTVSSFSFCFEYPRNMQKAMRKPKAKKPTTKPITAATPSPPVVERTAPARAQRASAAAKHPEPADTPDDMPQVEPEEVPVVEELPPSTAAKGRGRGRPSTKTTQPPAQAPVKVEESPAPAPAATARRSSARAAAAAAPTPRGRAVSRKNSQPVADTIAAQSPARSTAESSDADSSVSLSARKPARPRMKSVPRSSKSSAARAEAALSAKERRQREEEEEMARLQASFQVTHSSRRTTNSSRTPAPLYFDEFPVVRKSNRKRKAEEVEVDVEAGTDAGADADAVAGVAGTSDNAVASREESPQPPQSRRSGRSTRSTAKSSKAAKLADTAAAADVLIVADSSSSDAPDAAASKAVDVAAVTESPAEAAGAGEGMDEGMDDGASADTADAHAATDATEATETTAPMADVDGTSASVEEHDAMHDVPASTQPAADAPLASPAKPPKTLAAGADVTVMQVMVEEALDACPLAAVAADEDVDASVATDAYVYDGEDETCAVVQVPSSPTPAPVPVEDMLDDAASADAQASHTSLSNGARESPANATEDAAADAAMAVAADASARIDTPLPPSPVPAATQDLSLADVPPTIPSQDDDAVAVHFDSPTPTQVLSPAKPSSPAAAAVDMVVPSSQPGFLGDSQDDAPPAPLWVDVPRVSQPPVSATNSPVRPRRYSSVADVNAQVLSQRKRVRTVVRMRRFSLSRPASVTEEVQVVQPSPARLLGAMRRLQEASVDDTAALVAATQAAAATEAADGENTVTSSSSPAKNATDAVPSTVETEADVEAGLAALLRAEKDSVLAPAIAALEAVAERCSATASRAAAVMSDDAAADDVVSDGVADASAASQTNEVEGAASTDDAPPTSSMDHSVAASAVGTGDAAEDTEDNELAGLDLLHARAADSSDLSLLESLQAAGLDMSVADAESVTDALVRVVGAVGLRGEEAAAQQEVLAQLRAIPVGQAMLVQEEVDEAGEEASEDAAANAMKSDVGEEVASLAADVPQRVKTEPDAAVCSPSATPAARLLSPRVKSPFFSPRPADASMVTSPRMSLTLLAEPSALDLVQVLARAEAALGAAEEEAAAEVAAAEAGGEEENEDSAEEDMDIDMSLESVRGVDTANAAAPASRPAEAAAVDESLAQEDLDDLKTATLNLSFAGEPTAALSPLRQRRSSGRYRVVRAGVHAMLDDDDEEDDIAKAMAAVGALDTTVMAPAVDLYTDTTARADTTELDSSATSTFDDSDGLFSALARTAPSMRAHAQLPMTTHTHGYHPTLGYDDEDDFTSRLALQVVSEIADAFAKPLAPAAATPARLLPPSRTGLGTPARGIPLRERGTPLRDSHAASARASHPLATPRRGTLLTPAKPPSARATPARITSAHPTPSRTTADTAGKLTTPARRVPVQTPLKSAMRTPLREPLRMQTPARAAATPSRTSATPRSLRPTPLPRVALLPPKHVTHKAHPTPSSRTCTRTPAATPRPLPTPLRRGAPGSSRVAAMPKVAAAKAEVDFLRCQLLTTLLSPQSQPTLKPSPLAKTSELVSVGNPVPVASSPDATQPNNTPQRPPQTPTHHSTQPRTGRTARQFLIADSDNEDEEEWVGRRLDMGDDAVEVSPNSIPVVTDHVLQAFSPSNARTRTANPDSDATGLVHVTRRRR